MIEHANSCLAHCWVFNRHLVATYGWQVVLEICNAAYPLCLATCQLKLGIWCNIAHKYDNYSLAPWVRCLTKYDKSCLACCIILLTKLCQAILGKLCNSVDKIWNRYLAPSVMFSTQWSQVAHGTLCAQLFKHGRPCFARCLKFVEIWQIWLAHCVTLLAKLIRAQLWCARRHTIVDTESPIVGQVNKIMWSKIAHNYDTPSTTRFNTSQWVRPIVNGVQLPHN